MQRAWVQSLVRELRSHMLHSMAKKKKKKKRLITVLMVHANGRGKKKNIKFRT